MWKYGFLTLFLLFCLCLSATEKKDFEKAEREQCPSYYSCRLAKEWQRIESIIRSMELSLPDYDADCKEMKTVWTGRICGASQQGFRRILFAALSYNQQANI